MCAEPSVTECKMRPKFVSSIDKPYFDWLRMFSNARDQSKINITIALQITKIAVMYWQRCDILRGWHDLNINPGIDLPKIRSVPSYGSTHASTRPKGSAWAESTVWIDKKKMNFQRELTGKDEFAVWINRKSCMNGQLSGWQHMTRPSTHALVSILCVLPIRLNRQRGFTSTQVCIHVHIHIYICLRLCAYVNIYIHTYIYIYMCTHIFVYIIYILTGRPGRKCSSRSSDRLLEPNSNLRMRRN